MSLKISHEGRVLRLTLSCSEKKNSLSLDLSRALVDASKEAKGAILIDSEGPIFCSGMDLSSHEQCEGTRIHEKLFTLGIRSEVPIICAIQGPALGGGLGLIANSHIAIAAQGTQFGLTEVRTGMWPFVIWNSMVRALGERRALMLALTGRLFGTAEAYQWGLVHEVVAPIELDDRATAIAHQMAESSAVAIKLGLKNTRESRDLPLEDSIRLALQLRAEAFESADFREGLSAFQEKRKPEWPSLKTDLTQKSQS